MSPDFQLPGQIPTMPQVHEKSCTAHYEIWEPKYWQSASLSTTQSQSAARCCLLQQEICQGAGVCWSIPGTLASSQGWSTMRIGSTAKVLAKCKLKYFKISECGAGVLQPHQPFCRGHASVELPYGLLYHCRLNLVLHIVNPVHSSRGSWTLRCAPDVQSVLPVHLRITIMA